MTCRGSNRGGGRATGTAAEWGEPLPSSIGMCPELWEELIRGGAPRQEGPLGESQPKETWLDERCRLIVCRVREMLSMPGHALIAVRLNGREYGRPDVFPSVSEVGVMDAYSGRVLVDVRVASPNENRQGGMSPWSTTRDELVEVLEGRRLICYRSEILESALAATDRAHRIPVRRQTVLSLRAAGGSYDLSQWGHLFLEGANPRWSLQEMATAFGLLPPGGSLVDALDDCLALREVVCLIAGIGVDGNEKSLRVSLDGNANAITRAATGGVK